MLSRFPLSSGSQDNKQYAKIRVVTTNVEVEILSQFGGIIEHSVADGCDFGSIQENLSLMEHHIVPCVNL